jgi:mono/diheme cytochrome c family protein
MFDHRPSLSARVSSATALWLVVVGFAGVGADPGLRGGEGVDYSADVRPVLAKNCFVCHGADEGARQGDLRLDTPEGAFADLGGRWAIVEGKPGASEVIRRIFAEDKDDLMPPVDSRLHLSDEEKELLREWIRQGAGYDKHWAFTPPRRPAVPSVKDASWVRNPIDSFILRRLEDEGLQPAPEADRYTLARRVHLDLIGLPPTPDDADSFVSDHHLDAYTRLVDRLLASPHYGERWARAWLDLARYSDTNGYEKDRPRSVWAYRNWVIDALNKDLPFDQFTIDQIAGDMLPDATLEQRIATGFHRNTMENEEGGTDVEQFRFEAVVDRVNTTGTVWLGMTVGCAQCHSHKYDPLSQKEYYEMFAFLNNVDEPKLPLPDAEITGRRGETREEIARLESELEAGADGVVPVLAEKLSAWTAERAALASAWTPLRPEVLSTSKDTDLIVLDDFSVLAQGAHPNNNVYRMELQSDLPQITALRFEVLPHESLPVGGPGRMAYTINDELQIGDFFLSELKVFVTSDPGVSEPVAVRLGEATHSFAKEKCSAEKTLDGELDTGWCIGARSGKPHQAVYQLAEPLEAGARFAVELHQIYIHGMTLGRFRLSATSDPLPVVAAGVPAEVEAALLLADGERTEDERRRIRREFLLTAPELAEEQERIEKLRKGMEKYDTTLVLQERQPHRSRTTRIRHRGEYTKPRAEVQCGVPAMLHAFPEGAPRNRLTFARWLVDTRNPLVARVVVNRQWQAFFGRGIVRTTEDFGTQSALPTHPRLLDWLATEFMERGWLLKHVRRLIASSATYRQRSSVTPELLERDPQNLLLARGPRVRVSAEMVRDIVLVASGLLTPEIGGPSVFPPQPEGIDKISYGTLNWKTDTGSNRFRRALYTYAKRTNPYALFGTFDAPSGETCVVRRDRSNTPLQALTVLNDASLLEVVRALALRQLREGPSTTEARVADIFRRFLTRPADEEERAAISAFYHRQLARFRSGELQATDLVATVAGSGDPPTTEAPPAGVDLDEWAAWTVVARSVMNFDETITKE